MTLPWPRGEGPKEYSLAGLALERQGSLASLLLAAAALPPLAVTLTVAWQTWAAALMTMRPARQRLRRRVSTSVRHSSRGREQFGIFSPSSRMSKKTASATAEMLGASYISAPEAASPMARSKGAWWNFAARPYESKRFGSSASVFCAFAPSRSVGASQRGTKCDGCSSNARATLEAVAYTRTNSPRWGHPPEAR